MQAYPERHYTGIKMLLDSKGVCIYYLLLHYLLQKLTIIKNELNLKVNFPFTIELVSKGEKATLYTIRIGNDTNTEFHKFANNSEVKKNEHYGFLLQRLTDVRERHGFKEYWFKYEIEPVYAFFWGPKLRLYCIKWSPVILILGNGGIKNTRTYQQDSHLNDCVEKLIYIYNRLENRERKGEITTNYALLEGDLNFKRGE